MTQPDQVRGAENQSAQERLRKELLISGLYDWVPLVQVESVITRADLAETLPAQQDLALQTIRSLVEDGLMEIGDLPNPGEKFRGWDLSIDAAMARVYDRFVQHYDDPTLWEFTIWLGLTETGTRLARKLEDKTATAE
ncbi:hypothetical protein BMW24_018305 [Mycobacterium heckeshornense]|uniref:Uncharacterized protein n=1 Tax=Mycobacterium heckeshornense TaxID=110505 RepID=A0A2G8B3L1_9MYCO|nr:hypothetical protein [Mycobacterium heckeshornense]KMV22601.1 hypothetical protein ACT16_09970 [Mycobacterium heckeshornense]MCV7034250.1 hypothetical protein [Mycobacterium heckeshornense]PIJ32347.1 hypothetical protein BMW24_018305 [Mycobacterium heckeshornense]BCO38323.1 hypothetical protein MHEC_47560 [Mycobacterium heckeshornense]